MDENREDEIFNSIYNLGKSHREETKKGLDKLFENLFKNGMMPKDAFGITDQKAEQLYAQAYQLFNSGNYKDAQYMFTTLVALNPVDPKYMFGLAASNHMLGHFTDAANSYMGCAMLDVENPIPFFHASDCWLQLEDRHAALVCLKMAIKRAGDNPAYSTIKDRAVLTADTLTKQLTEEDVPESPADGAEGGKV